MIEAQYHVQTPRLRSAARQWEAATERLEALVREVFGCVLGVGARGTGGRQRRRRRMRKAQLRRAGVWHAAYVGEEAGMARFVEQAGRLGMEVRCSEGDCDSSSDDGYATAEEYL